jgi:hypothetical protein
MVITRLLVLDQSEQEIYRIFTSAAFTVPYEITVDYLCGFQSKDQRLWSDNLRPSDTGEKVGV